MDHKDGRPANSRRSAQVATLDKSFASSASIRRRMQSQPSRDTAPELALRRVLHALGLRYRVDRAPLRGLRRRADVVFGPTRVAVYVDGCFWHVCPQHGTWPRANAEWWKAKLERNKARDVETNVRLEAEDWKVIRVWEHELPEAAAFRIAALVEIRRQLLRESC